MGAFKISILGTSNKCTDKADVLNSGVNYNPQKVSEVRSYYIEVYGVHINFRGTGLPL